MSLPGRQIPLRFALKEDATFANYIGDAAAKIKNYEGFTYLWGEPQSGCSHLLQSSCHVKPSSIYISSLVDHEPEIIRDLEFLQLVCLDDIHKVLPNRAWEEAIFHLINACRDNKVRLIMSGKMPASALKCGLVDLRTRLIAANVIETDVLDDAQRLQLLIRRAASRHFELSEEAGQFILNRTGRDMASMTEMLAVLESESMIQQRKITIPFAKKVLKL